MDAIYYISGALMIPTFIGLLVAIILFLIKPHLLQKFKYINKPISRVAIFSIGATTLFVAFIGYGSVLATTEPANIKQERLTREAAETRASRAVEQKAKEAAEAQRKSEEEARKPVIKTETKTEVVPFESTEQQDNTLIKGQTRVAIEGTNGERTITYEVTYVQNKETARKEIKNEVIKTPVTKVMLIGTYVAPPTAPAPTAPNPAPQTQSNVRVGAVCEDGWHSAATGRGACSHHGGVAYWLYG